MAIAATTQIGDQGLTIGRYGSTAGRPAPLGPGLRHRPDVRRCVTAVTTVASGIAFGAYDVAIAGGVEHMGRHPMGEGSTPTPGSSPSGWWTSRRW